MSALTWSVVQTQPNCETKAKRHLVNQDFTVYLPMVRRRVRHARRSQIVLRPLFPCYLFVRLDPARDRWRSINGTVGVKQVLADGDAPRILPDKVVDEIVAREDGTGAVKLVAPDFVAGQEVRLLDGPLADMSGLFSEMRDADRVVLLMSMLGRQVRVVAPAAEVTTAA